MSASMLGHRHGLKLLIISALFTPPLFAQSPDSLTVTVYFRQAYSTLQPDFQDNGARLDEFVSRLSDSTLRLSAIDIVAFASPEGKGTLNRKLSRRRANAIHKWLTDNAPFVPDSIYNVEYGGVNWRGLREMVEADSAMKYRGEVLRVLADVPETTYRNGRLVDSRLKRLMDLRGGRPYWYLYEKFFPTLRSAGAYVTCRFETAEPVEFSEFSKLSEFSEKSAQSDKSDKSDLSDSSAPPATPEPFAPAFALKSNALFLAAGVTNAGVEYAFAPHWSVDLPVVYSPYTLARTYRLRFLYVQPELRYWFDRQPLKGHFVGAHFHGGVFNVSLNDKSRYQSEKGFHGAGISYGYSLPFARQWSAEFTVGLGYAYTRYCTYYNVSNGIRYQKDIPYHYWGLTKLGINIVYRFP